MSKNYYQILGIEKTATEAEIKKTYRKLALKWHPDKNGNSEESKIKFQEITEAYVVLSSSKKKAEYDRNQGSSSPLYPNSQPRSNNFGFDTFSDFLREEINHARREKDRLRGELRKCAENKFKIGVEASITVELAEKGVHFNEEKLLGSNLWTSYGNWREKLRNLPIGEVERFKEQMFAAIKELGKKLRVERQREQEESDAQLATFIAKTEEKAQKKIEEVEKTLNRAIQDFDQLNQKINSILEESRPIIVNNSVFSHESADSNINSHKQEIETWLKDSEVWTKETENIKKTYIKKTSSGWKYKRDGSKESDDFWNYYNSLITEKTDENINDNVNKGDDRLEGNQKSDYKNFTKEQLIKEIGRLKSELKESKRKKDTKVCRDLEIRLKQSENLLREFDKKQNSPNSDNKFFTKLLIGGGVIAIGIVLLAVLIKRNKSRRK